MKEQKFRLAASWLSLVFFLLSASLRADIDEVVRAQQLKLQKATERFSKFTSDKNVMGQATDGKGGTLNAPDKQKFDSDGAKLLTFQSELTYHTKAFDVIEEENGGQGGGAGSGSGSGTVKKLYGFVSEHGKEGEGGGSSELERKVYQLHEQFNKEEEKDKPKQEGVEFKSVFKVTTKKVPKQEESGGAGSGGLAKAKDNDDGDKDKEQEVARWELRDEVVQEIEKIGENSFETVKASAKDEEDKDKEEVMPNGILAREAGNRALKAMQASALKALSQRRINRGIRDGALPERVQLWEDAPTCDAWAQQAAQAVQDSDDPKQIEERQKDVERMTQQCKQMTSINYKEIMPRFVEEEGQSGQQSEEQLKSLGVNKEDARERDLRVQMSLLEQYGKTPQEIQNNWNYSEKDIQNEITLYDESGNETGKQMMTPAEQLQAANENLQRAKAAAESINSYLPDANKIDTSNTLSGMVNKGERAAWDITKVPDQAKEDFGITVPSVPQELQTYEDVLQQ